MRSLEAIVSSRNEGDTSKFSNILPSLFIGEIFLLYLNITLSFSPERRNLVFMVKVEVGSASVSLWGSFSVLRSLP